ncbi:MAG: hypothetical protein HYY24_03445 [Verrucomicrobia bacterium]|nr:hypothetical protein [Verrucomicrobiota bacterium]
MQTRPASPALERARLIVVLATVAINVVAVIAFGFLPGSDWRTGLGLNLFDNALLIFYSVRWRDRMMPCLMLFGLAVGVVELAADAWLVDFTRTLDYSLGGGPMLWRSPIWMPLAWEIVAVQFGYIGLRLWERWGARGLWLAGALGAINIPFYEEMALRTHWWQYANCRMLLHTPYYIILGEFAIAAALGVLARQVRSEGAGRSLLAGAIGGASIFVSYAVPYWVVDRLL